MIFDPIYFLFRLKRLAKARIQVAKARGELTGENVLRGGVVLFALILLLSVSTYPNNSVGSGGEESSAPKPTLIANSPPPPKISAQSAYLVDLKSDSILYDKNSSLKLPLASATKLATALVALESYQLDELVGVHPRCIWKKGESIMGLYSREKITVEALLRGMLIASASDAACALANHYPGGAEAFVREMNGVAASLGLEQTYFANPSGLDGASHYSTAYDLTILAKEAIKRAFIQKVVRTEKDNVSAADGKHWHLLKTTNKLLGKRNGILGVKTGYTTEAKGVFIFYFEKGGVELLGTVMGSNKRFEEAETLLNWALTSFIFTESNRH